MPRAALALFALAALTACFPSTDDSADTDDSSPPEHLATCEADMEGITVGAASIDGDTLTLDVGYSGCSSVDFTLCWPDQAFMESYPVQARLALWSEHPGDCEMALSETLEFDLAPLKQSYIDGYQTEHDTIIVHIGEQTVDYVF